MNVNTAIKLSDQRSVSCLVWNLIRSLQTLTWAAESGRHREEAAHLPQGHPALVHVVTSIGWPHLEAAIAVEDVDWGGGDI